MQVAVLPSIKVSLEHIDSPCLHHPVAIPIEKAHRYFKFAQPVVLLQRMLREEKMVKTDEKGIFSAGRSQKCFAHVVLVVNDLMGGQGLEAFLDIKVEDRL